MTRYSFVRTIVEDPDHPGELLLDLGDELCEQMGWKPGDTIDWKDQGDGSFVLSRVEPKSTATPALGVMATGIYNDARSFRVACDCHSNHHDVDVWIEAESDNECQDITVTFYRELDTPFWERGFNRFREAWNILIHGRSRFSGSLIMKAETAETLCNAIRSSIELLKKP